MKRRKAKARANWPPAEYRLPDTLEGIEAGRPDQAELIDQTPEARRQRLLSIGGRLVVAGNGFSLGDNRLEQSAEAQRLQAKGKHTAAPSAAK